MALDHGESAERGDGGNVEIQMFEGDLLLFWVVEADHVVIRHNTAQSRQ